MARWRESDQPRLFEAPLAWEQLDGEPSKPYAAFCVFRDMGPSRTIDETGLRVYPPRRDSNGVSKGRNNPATGRIRAWAARYDWRRRAEAWDREVQRKRDTAYVEEVRKLAEQQAQLQRVEIAKRTEFIASISQEEIRNLPVELRAKLAIAAADGFARALESHRVIVAGSKEDYAESKRPKAESEAGAASAEPEVVVNLAVDAEDEPSREASLQTGDRNS